MREMNNVEERILDKALYLMGKAKSCDISVRAIAGEAGVNVSAINYYFRSKDEMLRWVKEFYIENSLAVLEILRKEEGDAEERLLLAANEIMEYALRFPGNAVIRSHSRLHRGEEEVSKRTISLTDEIGIRLKQLFERVIGQQDELQFKYIVFISSINYPTDYDEILEFDGSLLTDSETRMNYLRLLIGWLREG